jgi:hypothetical protein
MKEDIEMRTYNQIMRALRALGADYPVDTAVAEGLVAKDSYEDAEKCRYILWLYEEHLARTLGPAATVDEHDRNAIWRRRASDSIEHIFPQSPGREKGWTGKMRRGRGKEKPIGLHVGRTGNLLLLPIVLNQESKIRPFEEKKQIYAKHNLRMIQEVCEKADWTLKQIEEREAKIVEWAKTQWSDI